MNIESFWSNINNLSLRFIDLHVLKAGSAINSEFKKSKKTRKTRTESETSLCSNSSCDSGSSVTSGNECISSRNNFKKRENGERKGIYFKLTKPLDRF